MPPGGFVLDYFWAEAMLAVELDGGQHHQPAGTTYDAGPDTSWMKLGVGVLRLPDDALQHTDAVLEKVLEVATERRVRTR